MSLERQVRQVIAQLDLVSHVSAVTLDSSGGRDMSDDIGGKRPPGGIDRKGDRDPDFPLKSADHYRRRATRAHSQRALQAVLDDATASLKAWKLRPHVTDPEWGSFEWKRQIALDVETGKRSIDGARAHYSVSRATVYRYIATYGTRAA